MVREKKKPGVRYGLKRGTRRAQLQFARTSRTRDVKLDLLAAASGLNENTVARAEPEAEAVSAPSPAVPHDFDNEVSTCIWALAL